MHVTILYNLPTLAEDHPDYGSEAGVLETVAAVERALGAAGHATRLLPVVGELPRLITELTCRPTDVVFNLCEGLRGTGAGEAQVAAVLDLVGMPHTGAAFDCLALVRNKPRTKLLLTGAGIPTPQFHFVEQGADPPTGIFASADEWIVKPAYEDASLGISADSVVRDEHALARQLRDVHRRYGPALVERFVDGRELNAAVIDLDGPTLLPLAEIVFAERGAGQPRLVTYHAKWSPDHPEYLATPVECPAAVEASLAQRIEELAIGAFLLTGCRDYARVDFRISATGEASVLEVNANPDLSPLAGFPRALAVAGTDYDRFIVKLAAHAAKRPLASVPARPVD